jgi:diketogulonate reductase-like aldo/keto reductase
LIDTAELYGNEELIAAAVASSGVHRESLTLSSKVGRWCDAEPPAEVTAAVPPEYAGVRGVYVARGSGGGPTLSRGVCIGGAASTREALNRTLSRLRTSYLDLYLLHWPLSRAAYALDDGRHAGVRLEAWSELVRLKRAGLVRAIGLSNFSPRQMAPLLEVETPAVLQLEMHPLWQRRELRAYCEQHGILLQAYGHHKPELRASAALQSAAAQLPVRDLGPAAVGLLGMRWALQSGAAVIPRSSKLEYVAANRRVFEVPAYSAEMMRSVAELDRGQSLYGLVGTVHESVM